MIVICCDVKSTERLLLKNKLRLLFLADWGRKAKLCNIAGILCYRSRLVTPFSLPALSSSSRITYNYMNTRTAADDLIVGVELCLYVDPH